MGNNAIAQIILIAINIGSIGIATICIYTAFRRYGIQIPFTGIFIFLVGIRFLIYSAKDVKK